jgi:hypothetical protein
MEQRRRWPSGKSTIAIRSPRCDALEQSKNAAYTWNPVERGHEMHLAGAGIGKAGINPAGDKRPNKAFGAIHGFFSRHRSVPGSFSRRIPRLKAVLA